MNLATLKRTHSGVNGCDVEQQRAEQQRPCERQCQTCERWLFYNRFKRRLRKTPHGTVWEFDRDCKACQQIKRNERKNEDRPRAIIENRAADWAYRLGVTRQFMLVNMNWNALIPVVRAMLTPEATCLNCGHKFLGERDIHIEHREPWRHLQDWARHHARNIALDCCACNNTKKGKPYSEYLNEQEEARLANEESEKAKLESAPEPVPVAIEVYLPGFEPVVGVK